MRQNIWIWWVFVGILFLYTSCSSDDRISGTDTQAIRFAVSPSNQAEETSRSVINGSYLPETEFVGVFAYSYASSSSSDWQDKPDIFDNAKGTVKEPQIIKVGDTETTIQAITLPEKYYVAGCKHAFYSYYPYRELFTANNTILTADLFSTLETDGSQTDWLWAEPVKDVVASTTMVQLTYSHIMTLVSTAVAKRADVTATLKMQSMTISTYSLNGKYASQKFTFDVSSGTVNRVDGGATEYTESLVSLDDDVEQHYVVPLLEDGETLATEVASQIMLLPGSVVTSLSFRVNGEDFTTPSDWAGFTTSTGGKYRFVSIVLGVNEITIQLGGKDWEEGGETDLTQSDVTISLGAKGWDYDPATDIDMSQSGISIPLGAKKWVDYAEPIVVGN